MIERKISLFAPGRLCLFGEHSDWAGVNRTMNPDIVPGCAIVTGVEQGIYAIAYKSEQFVNKSKLPEFGGRELSCDMDMNKLRDIAKEGGFFSYVAGVASYMCEWYHVGGITVEITKMDLPMKSGLSSSAAICVLVAQAFNVLYDLHLNTLGIMNIAYWGEQRTPSRCGRLDQACAFGVNPVSMVFDGNEIEVEPIEVKKPLHFVFADLMAGKDTVKILADLSAAYPFAETEAQIREQEALGPDNKIITDRAKEYIALGDAAKLGQLMVEAQALFDTKIAPNCPEELTSPVLHSVLNDEKIKQYTYGAKGVGSQGDGTVQFLACDEEKQKALIEYLENVRGMRAYPLTLGKENTTIGVAFEEIIEENADAINDFPNEKSTTIEREIVSETVKASRYVRKAIIPVAGFGTRLYPQTRGVKKEFCPVVDKDGLLKPGILVLLEELDRIGIEEICMILNRDEKAYYEEFFFKPLPQKHLDKLKPNMLEYEKTIRRIASKLSFVFQEEQKGFGHAVFQAKDFADGEPVLLMLGDTIYDSNTEVECTKQLMNAFGVTGRPTVALQSVEVSDVATFGIFAGKWESSSKTLMRFTSIAEKPTPEFAKENLAMQTKDGNECCYAAFGSYILTEEVFDRLSDAIDQNIVNSKGEIELTDALSFVSENYGMYGAVIDGVSFDLGNPDAYRNAVSQFGLR